MANMGKTIKGLECCAKQDQKTCFVDCPYYDEDEYDAPYTCKTNLCMDALELLKAQQPKVMTLEEVKSSIGEAIWFESRHTYMSKKGFWIIPSLIAHNILLRYVHSGSSHYSELGLNDYHKIWRCWTSKPTEKQREETPWQI